MLQQVIGAVATAGTDDSFRFRRAEHFVQFSGAPLRVTREVHVALEYPFRVGEFESKLAKASLTRCKFRAINSSGRSDDTDRVSGTESGRTQQRFARSSHRILNLSRWQ